MLAASSVVAGSAAARPEAAPGSERLSLSGSYLAGRLAGTLRDNAAASTFFKAAMRIDSRSPEVVERAFQALLAQGNVNEAASLAERIVQLNRQHRLARLAIAVRAIKARQYQVARTQLAQPERVPIADLTATLLAAWTAYGAGDVKSAIEQLDKLQGPDWYATFRDLHAGLILDLAGRKKEAGKRLKAAYATNQTELRLVDAYARWAARNGERDTALELYAGFDKVMPKHPLVVEAVETLETTGTLPPLVRSAQEGAAEVLYGLGSALGHQGGEDFGVLYLQLALHLTPQHPLALLSLADVFETLKKPDLAIDIYERVADRSPLKRNAEIQRGLNLDQLDRTDEAKTHLEQLVKAEPDDLTAVLALGNVLRGRKQFEEAATIYTVGIDNLENPERRHWVIFYFRGICHERTKAWPKAEADFKKALELYPDQPHVLNYLGYSWVDQGVNLDQGLDMIRRAVKLRPDDGYIVDSLGWAQYKLGRIEEAVVALERAIELKPEDPVINDHLGDAYWKVGRKLEAMFQWSHARDLKPEPEDLVNIEAKLKNGLRDEPKPKAEASDVGNGG